MSARSARLRARIAGTASGEAQSGQIMILTLGLAMVVLALVFVVVSVSSVQIERKQLLAMADAAALDAATRIDAAAYYASGRGEVEVSDSTVRIAVGDYLANHAGAIGLERARMAEPTGSPDGRTVEVTLTTVADIPLIPWFLEGVEGLRLRVSTTARAG